VPARGCRLSDWLGPLAYRIAVTSALGRWHHAGIAASPIRTRVSPDSEEWYRACPIAAIHVVNFCGRGKARKCEERHQEMNATTAEASTLRSGARVPLLPVRLQAPGLLS